MPPPLKKLLPFIQERNRTKRPVLTAPLCLSHLVQQRDGRLQDLLPLVELRLVELPLQLQNLGPLPGRLRQRAEGQKWAGSASSRRLTQREDFQRGTLVHGSTAFKLFLSQFLARPTFLDLGTDFCRACLPVRDRVGVPRLQGVGRPLQSVQLVEQQHVESHQHHQASRQTGQGAR